MKMTARIVLTKWFPMAAILFTALSSWTPTMAAPPFNDIIDNARVIDAAGEILTVDLSEATADPGEPACAGEVFQSVWFAYTAIENQFVTISIEADDAAVSLLPSVSVWTFGDSQDLQPVECPLDAEEIEFMATLGRTYYIQVFFSEPERIKSLYFLFLAGSEDLPNEKINAVNVGCEKYKELSGTLSPRIAKKPEDPDFISGIVDPDDPQPTKPTRPAVPSIMQ